MSNRFALLLGPHLPQHSINGLALAEIQAQELGIMHLPVLVPASLFIITAVRTVVRGELQLARFTPRVALTAFRLGRSRRCLTMHEPALLLRVSVRLA
jgi:hypothetical protein